MRSGGVSDMPQERKRVGGCRPDSALQHVCEHRAHRDHDGALHAARDCEAMQRKKLNRSWFVPL